MLAPISLFKERFGDARYFLAPMAGITDTVFRLLMREMGAQIVISELLSSEGLVRGNHRTFDILRYDERERPVGIQIFGNNIHTMVESAKIIQEEGADFVDVNFGCPVRKVVTEGGGSAWLKNPQAMGELLTKMKNSIRIPLTIKVRTGWDENTLNVKEVVDVAAQSGVSWVAIHGRTRAQGYMGYADWELIQQVAIHSKIPIIGNGDILRADQANQRIAGGYAHGVMIGRGALKNPWIFREALNIETNKDFLSLIERHFEIALEKKTDQRAFLSLKKFMSWYASGYVGCSNFRSRIFATSDIVEMKKTTVEFFTSVKDKVKQDDGQPFLMGGDG